MKERDHKMMMICDTIQTRIDVINKEYRHGPDLYFYKRVFNLRQNCSVEQFLRSDYNIEILYATLVAWDMNSRSAKMLYFDTFKKCLTDNIENFRIIESYSSNMEMLNRQNLQANLDKIYEKLNFMESAGRLVSNSKVLHFLFPYLLIPMDRNNTLMYLYNNTSESKEKYLEIIDMSIELIQGNIHWIKYLDNNWNTTLPKMIDNAIIILVGKSLKNKSA